MLLLSTRVKRRGIAVLLCIIILALAACTIVRDEERYNPDVSNAIVVPSPPDPALPSAEPSENSAADPTATPVSESEDSVADKDATTEENANEAPVDSDLGEENRQEEKEEKEEVPDDEDTPPSLSPSPSDAIAEDVASKESPLSWEDNAGTQVPADDITPSVTDEATEDLVISDESMEAPPAPNTADRHSVGTVILLAAILLFVAAYVLRNVSTQENSF